MSVAARLERRPAALAGVGRAARPAIGEILLARGAVTQGNLAEAVALQPEIDCRLGEILCARGWTRERELAAALAEQWGLPTVDTRAAPREPGLTDPSDDPGPWLEGRLLPWRREADGRVLYVTDDPLCAFDAPGMSDGVLAVVTGREMDAALMAGLGPALARRAAERTPAGESVRSLGLARPIFGLALPALALVLLSGATGGVGPAAGAAALLLLNALTGLLRLGALVAGRRVAAAADAPNLRLARWPRLSVLVALYREARMVPEIAAALEACDYPRELLDVKFLVEEDDAPTRAALDAMALPGWMSVLVVPRGHPRTKPRALNFALDFCRGDIVGVLDAEDRPDPDQFRRVARHLTASPSEVACVQCQLSHFNARENWITRCFQLEYAIWFDVLLRGFQRLGLPIPLGGTSVYFRRETLEIVGGWDAHNVTEDADLGMRLARRGYRVEVVDATTEEEANCRALPWIRQRSRWLKGYLLTWLSHMRRPARLARELGPAGFLGLNVLLLGGALSYLAMPVFWLSLGVALTTGHSIWAATVPGWILWTLAVSLGLGQAVMLGCAVLAARRRRATDLLPWIPLLPIYWTLGALAAWKAILEVILAPYYWDKTRHGLSACLGQRAGGGRDAALPSEGDGNRLDARSRA